MKKIFALLMAICIAATSVMAQTKPGGSVKKEVVKPASKTKADGTPDKRFKENKGKAKGHVKKDGTPDKRFKENKKVKG